MPWVDDLITVMENAGVGVQNTNLFATSRATVPVLPNGAATLHILGTAGTSPMATQTNRAAMRQPGAQFIARADEFDEAMAMAQAAYTACVNVNNAQVNGHLIRWIRPNQEPFDPGVPDDRGQVQVMFNVLGNYSD